LGGMPSRVVGYTRTALHEIETEDEAFALLEYPNGAHGYVYATTNEEPNENIIEICGDRGKILLCNDQLEVWTLKHSIKQFTYESAGMWEGIPSERVRFEPEPLPDGALTEQPAIIQNFARAILQGEPLIAPGEHGLWAMELINAIILSSKRGKPVEVPVDRAEYDQLLAELRAQSRPKTRVREQKVTDPKLG
ncbi:MAG: Gfo/Idh/MocA family oxidoreductase, partial [Fimbriimonadales bacterium]